MKLKALILFLLFISTLEASIAKFTLVYGEVLILREGIELKVEKGDNLYKKDIVKSLENSKVQILFNDGSILNLASKGTIEIKEYFYNEKLKQNSKMYLDLSEGKIELQTGKIADIEKDNFKIKTVNSTIEIKEGIIIVNKDMIACFKGLVLASSLDKTVVLSAREYIKVSNSSLPSNTFTITDYIKHLLTKDIVSKDDFTKKRVKEDNNIFYWGEDSKLNISKQDVKNIIKKHLYKTKPQKVKKYQLELENKKSEKIAKYSAQTFVHKGLMWQDNKDILLKKLNHLESKIYCRKLVLANKTNWRVPTYEELLSIVDYKKNNPSSLNGIKYMQPLKYWTISKFITDKSKYWVVDFKNGTTFTVDKQSREKVRCVREISKRVDDY